MRSGLDSAVINQRLATGAGPDAAAVTTDTNLGPAELAQIGGDEELGKRVAPATSATPITSPSTRR